MQTKVIHIKDTPKGYKTNPDYVYIGRPSIFGNPYPLTEEIGREKVLEDYKSYFYQAIEVEEFRNLVFELAGKTLVCYCAPKACHGDVIAEYLNGLQESALPK